jgi:hypothetical protein
MAKTICYDLQLLNIKKSLSRRKAMRVQGKKIYSYSTINKWKEIFNSEKSSPDLLCTTEACCQ